MVQHKKYDYKTKRYFKNRNHKILFSSHSQNTIRKESYVQTLMSSCHFCGQESCYKMIWEDKTSPHDHPLRMKYKFFCCAPECSRKIEMQFGLKPITDWFCLVVNNCPKRTVIKDFFKRKIPKNGYYMNAIHHFLHPFLIHSKEVVPFPHECHFYPPVIKRRRQC